MSERWQDRLTMLAVLVVAGVAAYISYTHIVALAIASGQSWGSAHAEPLSVDGLIAAASGRMMRAVRRGDRTTWLQWASLSAGVAATLAANVVYGWPGGLVSAVVSGWPAVAFVLAEAMLVHGRAGQPDATVEPQASQQAKRIRVPPKSAEQLAGRPDMKPEELAAATGVSVRTARRHVSGWRELQAAAGG